MGVPSNTASTRPCSARCTMPRVNPGFLQIGIDQQGAIAQMRKQGGKVHGNRRFALPGQAGCDANHLGGAVSQPQVGSDFRGAQRLGERGQRVVEGVAHQLGNCGTSRTSPSLTAGAGVCTLPVAGRFFLSLRGLMKGSMPRNSSPSSSRTCSPVRMPLSRNSRSAPRQTPNPPPITSIECEHPQHARLAWPRRLLRMHDDARF